MAGPRQLPGLLCVIALLLPLLGSPARGAAAVSDLPDQAVADSVTELTVTPEPHHLRKTEAREWADFPEHAESGDLEVRFDVSDPDAWKTILVRQEDVRRPWSVALNGRRVALLQEDEAPLVHGISLPPDVLVNGSNVLRVWTDSEEPDDVRVGPIRLVSHAVEEYLHQSRLDVSVRNPAGERLAARITIVGADGALQPLAADARPGLAVRPGVAYTTDGLASLHLPAGNYRIFASRGPGYEADSVTVDLEAGEMQEHVLEIRHVLPAADYVSIDPHVHTGELSGHGDASVRERLVTSAGEGLDVVVLTDHNLNATLADSAAALFPGLGVHFIAGNEYTTPMGHFNVFPVEPGTPAPGPEVENWDEVAGRIRAMGGDPVVILNHGRDLHAGFTPLGPTRFLALTGERLDASMLPAAAMEVWNSSAQRQDPLDLHRDWMAMANRGDVLVAIGSSDSHDVSRYGLGQGRTYVRCDGCLADGLDQEKFLAALASGRALPSMGLLVELFVDGALAAGEIVSASDSVVVEVRVWGPSWMPAEEVILYQNGEPLLRAPVSAPGASGLKAALRRRIPAPRQDVAMTALATAAAPRVPFWPIPKPYQRMSPLWEPIVAGGSGLVRVNSDGDDRWSSAYEYARAVVDARAAVPRAMVRALGNFDSAVALQAASILASEGVDFSEATYKWALNDAPPHVSEAFQAYQTALEAFREDVMKETTDR